MISRGAVGLALLACAKFAAGFEYCSGGIYYCPDDGDEIGYCCGWTYGGVALCCTYLPWYEMWYVWTGIVVFLLMVASCAAICRRQSRRRQATSTTRAVSVTTVSTDENGIVNPMYNKPLAYSQAPPSYDTLNHHHHHHKEAHHHHHHQDHHHHQHHHHHEPQPPHHTPAHHAPCHHSEA